MEYQTSQLSTDDYFKNHTVIQREDGRLQYVPKKQKPQIQKNQQGKTINKQSIVLPEVGVVGTRNYTAYRAYQDSLNAYNSTKDLPRIFKEEANVQREAFERYANTNLNLGARADYDRQVNNILNDSFVSTRALADSLNNERGNTMDRYGNESISSFDRINKAMSKVVSPSINNMPNELVTTDSPYSFGTTTLNIYKKPTNVVELYNRNVRPMSYIKASPKPAGELKTREFVKPKPKFKESKTDFNFYGMANAAAWGDDTKPVGYYDIGEGRVNVSMKDLSNMGDLKNTLFGILGNNTAGKFESANKLSEERNKIKKENIKKFNIGGIIEKFQNGNKTKTRQEFEKAFKEAREKEGSDGVFE